jgi:hypothetical protein
MSRNRRSAKIFPMQIKHCLKTKVWYLKKCAVAVSGTAHNYSLPKGEEGSEAMSCTQFVRDVSFGFVIDVGPDLVKLESGDLRRRLYPFLGDSFPLNDCLDGDGLLRLFLEPTN